MFVNTCMAAAAGSFGPLHTLGFLASLQLRYFYQAAIPMSTVASRPGLRATAAPARSRSCGSLISVADATSSSGVAFRRANVSPRALRSVPSILI